METKISILGQEPEEEKKLKPIELVEVLQYSTGDWYKCKHVKNSDYDFFELNPYYKVRGMQVITTRRRANIGTYQIWLGHWNDGVV